MLDLLRRHSSSWLVRIAFGAIIASFVLFFGYSASMNFGGAPEDAVMATIDGHPLSQHVFKLFEERNRDNIMKSFGNNKIPPELARQMVGDSTMRQMAFRTLLLAEAEATGLVITDERLADAIVKGHTPEGGESFDPIAYQHRFLPSFRQEYGVDYESLVRDELLIDTMGKIFDPVTLQTKDPPPLSILDAWMQEMLARAEIQRLEPK